MEKWFNDSNPSLASMIDATHRNMHQASVGRSPREHCISRLPELISSFYCRQTNAVSISRKRDPILLGPREGGGGGSEEEGKIKPHKKSFIRKAKSVTDRFCGVWAV